MTVEELQRVIDLVQDAQVMASNALWMIPRYCRGGDCQLWWIRECSRQAASKAEVALIIAGIQKGAF